MLTKLELTVKERYCLLTLFEKTKTDGFGVMDECGDYDIHDPKKVLLELEKKIYDSPMVG